MGGNRYDSFPVASKGEAAVVNYHQIAGSEEDDGFTTRYSPGHTSEKPESVLEKGLHSSKFTIHIMALATTAAVVGVNFVTVYGWDQETLRIPGNQVNNHLQFAAKLQELFIVGSLTSMAMHRASLGALITLPTLAVDGARRNDTFWDLSQQNLLISCLINSKWAAAKIQYEPKDSNQLIQNIPELGIFGVGDGRNVTEAQPWGLSEMIYIFPEWAVFLNVAGIASTSTSGESLTATMIEALLSQFVASDTNSIYSPYMALGAKFAAFAPPQTYNVLPATIAAVVTEGLSRRPTSGPNLTLYLTKEGLNNTTFTNLEQQKEWNSSGLDVTNMSLAAIDAIIDSGSTPIGFTIERYRYGYGYQDGTVMFGLVVLLTHAAVAIGYILYSILHRMLALALHSDRARELQNVGGGVDESSTWKMRVRVRELGGNRLELVVGARYLDSARPKLDKKYQ